MAFGTFVIVLCGVLFCLCSVEISGRGVVACTRLFQGRTQSM